MTTTFERPQPDLEAAAATMHGRPPRDGKPARALPVQVSSHQRLAFEMRKLAHSYPDNNPLYGMFLTLAEHYEHSEMRF